MSDLIRSGSTVDEGSPTLAEDFDEFYSAEYLRLFRAMVLLCGEPTEADDLTQEAFVRVFERWERVSAMKAPLSYLYRTALNIHRSRVGRAIRWGRRVVFERPVEDVSESATARAEVHRALRHVSAEQRKALILVDWVGMTSEEAGAVLGIQPGAVRGRVHRGHETLRRELTSDE